MHAFPECLDLFDETGTDAPLTVQISGLAPSEIGALPVFGDRLRWQMGDPGAQAGPAPAFHFVIWHEDLAGPLAAKMAAPDFRSIVVILHRADQVPSAASVRPVVHVCYEGEAKDAVLHLVAPLLMPLVYRSVVCVALEDFEFFFAHGGRLRCLAETRGEDLAVCLADLAWQLADTERQLGGFSRLLASMILPSPLPPVSVVDRVLATVAQVNSADDPDWLVSTLVHGEVTSRICVYALEAIQA